MKAQKSGFLSNLAWKFAERFSAQIISTVVSIILARLLEPEYYGIISIVMVFINIANVFVSDGLGSSLIQKKDATQLDFFSVLYFNLALSCLLYVGLFFAAPLITDFYGRGYEMLTSVLRVLGLRIIFTAVNSVQQAYVAKKMIFKKFFLATLGGTVLSAVVGIAMAYSGYGVWALVTQYLVNSIGSTIILAIVLKVRPRFMFSFARVKKFLPYGAHILGTGMLITGYQEIRSLIIGKVYSSASLAYYDKSRHFPSLLVTNLNSSISAVLFPKMSAVQDDPAKIKEYTKASISLGSYVLSPMMFGLAAVATPFVKVLLTEKWLPCVPLLQMFCLFYLLQPIHTANMQAIKAIGRSDIYLKLEIFKKVIEFIVLICTLRLGVTVITMGMTVCATAFMFVNAYPNIKLLNYGFKEQMADIWPNILLAAAMFAVVFPMQYLPISDICCLVLQVVTGCLAFLLLSLLVRNKSFLIIKDIIKGRFLKKR